RVHRKVVARPRIAARGGRDRLVCPRLSEGHITNRNDPVVARTKGHTDRTDGARRAAEVHRPGEVSLGAVIRITRCDLDPKACPHGLRTNVAPTRSLHQEVSPCRVDRKAVARTIDPPSRLRGAQSGPRLDRSDRDTLGDQNTSYEGTAGHWSATENSPGSNLHRP